ncbi:glycine betaine ABC transporter substrate-binding protein OsmF [Paracoccus aminophilus]|uniref:Osmoprotectant transport system, substrate-binding protein n=1 Tax=Paracoccus aminophilus JCM 7686 TaxID=1367847 RepID=S5YUD1_PARAH|nr:glycine betaine ABC transporter substrate-binding protein [Paracoccus aminophilus]AGT08851.1 osmoprotectant transport system, substrate-binding protein [Paracoccus aminophilus JCM 7686]
MKKTLLRAAVISALLGVTAQAALADVTVGSKINTEGGVLGYIILEALKANDIKVVDKVQLGATPALRDAIMQGQVDIYPEYTGNGAIFFSHGDISTWKDPQAAWERIKEMDYAANKIVWLKPAAANNTWGIAVREDLAEANHLKTLSDLGAFIKGGGNVKLAAAAEFVTSPTGLPTFYQAYDFTLSPDQLFALSGGDTAATIAAAAQLTSGVNAAMTNSTDGGITPSGLVVMEDDKHVQPVYQPTPIVREAVLKEYPQIETILDPIFAKLDMATLQDLNGRVQVEGEPAASVARDFLIQNGFAK